MLAHGSGGEESAHLISELFASRFDNPILRQNEDAACLPGVKSPAFCTDSFTVTPLFFNGGDIGKLSICGTANDLAMMGAQPLYLSCSFVIEEGTKISILERIVDSMAEQLQKIGAQIVTGDTKVLPKGAVDGVIINTSGIGEIRHPNISCQNLRPDDVVMVSGSVGDHGAEIFSRREGINLSGNLCSDCQLLWPMVEKILETGASVSAMRDATRGGLSAVLHEWVRASNVEIEVEESAIPLKSPVKGVCELLGFEPYHLANEGMFVLAVAKKDSQNVLELLQNAPGGEHARAIGRVKTGNQRVVLTSSWGTKRLMEYPSGELLPRIC